MKSDVVCFPAPLNACFTLPAEFPELSTPEPPDPQLEELKALATRTCYLCRLEELDAEDWD